MLVALLTYAVFFIQTIKNMSTQTFEVNVFEPQPNGQAVLSPTAVRQLCRSYNQHTSELDDFLTQFDVQEWVCLEVDIEDVYSKASRSGRMDCNPAELLGILLTSQHSDDLQQQFRSLVKGSTVSFSIDGNVRFQRNTTVYSDDGKYTVLEKAKIFNAIKDCPLWVLRVDHYSAYRLKAVVLLPKVLWQAEQLHSDSAGYAYTVADREWYRYEKANAYRAVRFGHPSSNFLTPIPTTLSVPYDSFWVDAATDRLFLMPNKHRPSLTFYSPQDQLTATTGEASEALAAINRQKPLGIYREGDHYLIPTKKKMLVTNDQFEELEERVDPDPLKGDFLQYYKDKGWTVLLTKRGIDIQSHKTQRRDKLSAFKIKATEGGLKRLTLQALDEDHLVILNGKWIVVDADLNIQVHSLSKTLKKSLAPILGKDFLKTTYPYQSLELPDRAPWLICNHLVLSADAEMAPIALNAWLQEKTGEFCFYGAIADAPRSGIWLLAGLGRLVFMDAALEQAFVFNTDPVGSLGTGEFSSPWLQLDQAGNLWFALNSELPICKIDHQEIDQQLQQAQPYGAVASV